MSTEGVEGELKVSEASGYPQLGLSSRYLRTAGVEPGEHVTVIAVPGAVLTLGPGMDPDDIIEARPDPGEEPADKMERLAAIWEDVTT